MPAEDQDRNKQVQQLATAIQNREAKVVIIGLGHVGVPVACVVAQAGFPVIGIDRVHEKIEQINRGICPIQGLEPGLSELLAEMVKSGHFRASMDYAECRDAQVILIAVETPVDEITKRPNYEVLRSVLKDLGRNLAAPILVVVESTIAPRTMEKFVKPILEAESGLTVNRDLYLSHCPERVMPGRLLANIKSCSRVVGGMNPEAAHLALDFYRHFVEAELDLTDCLTAELVKTAENAYRDVQIAFANEVALLCESVGANVYRVRELVNKSPYRAMHLPGAGVGGHCIPKDSWLLIAEAGDKFEPRVIPAARAVNDNMPFHMVELIQQALQKAGRRLDEAKVVVLGYAYLENSSDVRNSPSAPVINRLKELGAEVVIHDPYVEEYRGNLSTMIQGADGLVVMVAHSEYAELNLGELRQSLRTSILVDGRNLFDKEMVHKAGFVYTGIGNI